MVIQRALITLAVLGTLGVAHVAVAAGPEAGVNVNVVNTPLAVKITNSSLPVEVTDAFPRTPIKVAFALGGTVSYTVPAGQRLVIETTTADVECSAETGAAVYLAANGLRALSLTMSKLAPFSVGFGVASYFQTLSARLVLEPGEVLHPVLGCVSAAAVQARVIVSGYLLSVDSPSLAP